MHGQFGTIVVLLLVASLAHLPLPVWDGDDVGSRGAAQSGHSSASRDIDLILLGCDIPDDFDDGPTDDDPDNGTPAGGLGPVYRAVRGLAAADPVVVSFCDLELSGDAARIELADAEAVRWDEFAARAVRPRPAMTVLRL